MKLKIHLTIFAVFAATSALAKPIDYSGIYSNEEEVYFQKEAGVIVSDWLGFKISKEKDQYFIQALDPYQNPLGESQKLIFGAAGVELKNCGYFSNIQTFAPASCFLSFGKDPTNSFGAKFTRQDNKTTQLRRAREVDCWASIPKSTQKAGGGTDWYFKNEIKLFDQGGRAKIGGANYDTQAFEIKVRNVIWPKGPNKPSLVLYVFDDTNKDRAISYSWADLGANRIGINLRTMQASCSITNSGGK